MLSQTTEYALRAVVCLAGHPDGPLTSREVAGLTGVPASYLAKVLKVLARAGIVDSRRGRRGGFALASSPAAVTVLDVVNAVDPLQRIDSCPAGRAHNDACREVPHDASPGASASVSPGAADDAGSDAAEGAALCPLCRELDGAVAVVQGVFAECTIASLITDSRGGRAACLLPASPQGAFGDQQVDV